ncbi:uncharacterized protein A1O5_05950, partial [Cladophialophora psammophila CBS 110553]
QSVVDCLFLHAILDTHTETLTACSAMEPFIPHSVRTLGISKISLPHLRTLYDSVTIEPSIVQNHFYAGNNFDSVVRAFYAEKGISYQAIFVVKRKKLRSWS